MAIPTSGNLSIKAVAGVCRSICTAVVQGGGGASGSLSALSVSAGKGAPHGMREFYGYNPISTINVDVTVYYNGPAGGGTGLNGTIYLKGAGGVNICSCSLAAFTTYDEWVWTPPAGTYCVSWASVTVYCNYSSVFGSCYWTTDTTSGSNSVTNTFNTNEVVTADFYPY